MKTLLNHFKYCFVFSVICLVASCTDVPLSYNNTNFNLGILGVWKMSNGDLFYFFTSNVDKKLNCYVYSLDKKTNQMTLNSTFKAYFTTKNKNNKVYQFISFGNKEVGFANFEVKISKEKNLTITEVNDDLYFEDKQGFGISVFNSVERFDKYVDFYLENPQLYEKREVVTFQGYNKPNIVAQPQIVDNATNQMPSAAQTNSLNYSLAELELEFAFPVHITCSLFLFLSTANHF